LTVPEPPPRVLVPPEEEPLAAIGNGTDTPLSKSPQVQPTPLPVGGRRSVQTRGETEPRASEPASAAATSVLGPNTPAETPLELKPLPTGTEPNLDAKGVNATLTRVNTMLQSVDSRKYSSGTYKDAKQFVKIASERLKERNYTAAAEAADKALKLATDLVGR
jgi:hypothetical protein